MALLFEGHTKHGDLVVVELKPGGADEKLTLPERPFICGVILRDPSWSVKTWLSALVRNLIEEGAVYLAFWGLRCEEAHDIADHEREPFTPAEGEDVVMTTWHESELLVDFLWYLAFLACPTPGFYTDARRYLILDIVREAEPDLVGAIREIFIS